MKITWATLALSSILALNTALADDWQHFGWYDEDWAKDSYGYYDNDLDWQTGDIRWQDWYGDAQTSWDTIYRNDEQQEPWENWRNGKDADVTQTASQEERQGFISLIGRVTATTDLAMTDAPGDLHALVRLDVGNNAVAVVDLGAYGVETFDADEGERLVVLGRSARINGLPVVFAQYAAPLEQTGPITPQQLPEETEQQDESERQDEAEP